MTVTLSDFFCGAGGSSTGAIQVPGVRVAIAANHWDLAVQTHNSNHPDAAHDCADLSQVDPRRYPTTDILWASPECFPAGTLVIAEDGPGPIEEVRVGQRVLTHKGRWRPVVRTQVKTGSTVLVRGQGNTPGLEMTPNHRLWVRASQQKWNNEIRRYRRVWDDAGWLRADALLENTAYWATPTHVERVPHSDPPAGFGADPAAAWWLVGRWLGDGHVSTSGNNCDVVISVGYHQAEELGNTLDSTEQRWGRSDKRTAVAYWRGDRQLQDWLIEHFGHGAAGKTIPGWVLGMSADRRRALLDGYVSADGNVGTRRTRTDSVSQSLSLGIRLLAEGLGHRASLYRYEQHSLVIEGRKVNGLPLHAVAWETAGSSREAFEEDGHAWSRVRAVEPGREDIDVYNLEVEEDHSYVAGGIVVANCTNHSIAQGRRRADAQPDLFGEVLPDAAAERSRATMWDVIRFAEHHRYRAIIVENVVDAREWVLWPAWSAALTALGYEYRCISLNSMHAQALGPGAPQSRDRLYVVAWRSGERPPDLDRWTRPEADCPQHGRVRAIQSWRREGRTVGKYRSQYAWRCPRVECRNTEVVPEVRPAADAIDWSLPAVRIADRPRPLAEKTMRRIRDGFAAYARPLMVPAGGTWNDTAYPVDQPLRTRTTRETEGVAVPPLMVPVEGREGKRARPAGEPLRTCTARNETGLAVAPFIAELRGGGSSHRPVSEPLATVTASGNHHGLAVPDMVAPYYGNAAPRPADQPIPTVTTVERHALLAGGVVASVEDLGFRMLTPSEYAAAMEFPPGYVLLGNKRERVRLAGNAVTPPAARDLIAAVAEALTGEEIAPRPAEEKAAA